MLQISAFISIVIHKWKYTYVSRKQLYSIFFSVYNKNPYTMISSCKFLWFSQFSLDKYMRFFWSLYCESMKDIFERLILTNANCSGLCALCSTVRQGQNSEMIFLTNSKQGQMFCLSHISILHKEVIFLQILHS